jgi:hypothetical protein
VIALGVNPRFEPNSTANNATTVAQTVNLFR